MLEKLDLSNLKTLELLQELERREGVWIHIIEPYQVKKAAAGEKEQGSVVVVVEPDDAFMEFQY